MKGLASRQRARSVGAKKAATARTGGLWAAASNATWPPIEAPTRASRAGSTKGRLASQSIAASTSSGWRRPWSFSPSEPSQPRSDSASAT